MKITFRALAVAFTFTSVSACTTYTGDSLLKLSEQLSTYDQSKIISKAKGGVSNILDSLELSEEAITSLMKISPASVILDSESVKLIRVDNQLVVAGADTNIAFATNSIIISTGALHISHSSNNVIICGDDVDISHDGSLGSGNLGSAQLGSGSQSIGSLVISKGKTKISHARNTLIYAIKGVKISHARNVQAFNTSERKTSSGYINNILVKPLFHKETAPNKSLKSIGSAR